ncbi:hypothetical protein MKQ68_18925 [Chitinophaga horti]|uniref:Uncharacterized protein n=1 Tax=Chitinophaga horti TaxID=2920382 RepID=A0ABY6IXP8_9BACT|nr:hypothetical protein [Chitinophaga horti]UYQ92164.1 hypothetical protein MKQ68_18925 [Chitinophaga horti]
MKKLIDLFKGLNRSDWIAIAGVLIALISIFISMRDNRAGRNSDEDIARRSGAFDRALLSLSIGEFALPVNVKDTVNLIYGGEMDNASVNLSELPIEVTNRGQKDAENVTLILQYPKLSKLAVRDVNGFQLLAPSFLDIKRAISESESHLQVSYQIETLNPGFHTQINDLITLHETSLDQSVKVEDTIFRYRMKYSFLIDMSIGGKDMLPTSNVIKLSCIPANSLEELVRQDIKNLVRRKKGNYTAIYILPIRKRHATEKGNLDEFRVLKQNLYMLKFQDLTPNEEIAAGLYDHQGRLKKFFAFDAMNNLINTINMDEE